MADVVKLSGASTSEAVEFRSMSALPPKADIGRCSQNVR